jgi:hypothetical protein
VEEDSEGDNDSEEFYYGGQVSKSVFQGSILSILIAVSALVHAQELRNPRCPWFCKLLKNLNTLSVFHFLHSFQKLRLPLQILFFM